MTCIAWDGKTLAADKRACAGTLHRTTTKIFRVHEYLVGFCGDATQGAEMLAWWRGGAEVKEFPESQRNKDDWVTFIAIGKHGVDVYERTPYPMRVEDRLFACGSGREFALAAMHLGKTPREAVEVACAFDTGCGNGIDELRFD